jgi:hypothetical protein
LRPKTKAADRTFFSIHSFDFLFLLFLAKIVRFWYSPLFGSHWVRPHNCLADKPFTSSIQDKRRSSLSPAIEENVNSSSKERKQSKAKQAKKPSRETKQGKQVKKSRKISADRVPDQAFENELP